MTAAGAQWNYKAEEEDDSMKVGPGESMRREDRFRVSCHTWNLALSIHRELDTVEAEKSQRGRRRRPALLGEKKGRRAEGEYKQSTAIHVNKNGIMKLLYFAC